MSAKRRKSTEKNSRRQFLQAAALGGLGLIAPNAGAKAPMVPDPQTRGDVLYAPPPKAAIDVRIHLNQIGCLPHEPKRAVIAATGDILGGGFVVVDDAVVPAVRY